MTKIVVFGGLGMLGRAVVAAGEARGLSVVAIRHGTIDIADPQGVSWALNSDGAGLDPDVVINCAGILQPRAGSYSNMARANAIGPITLSQSLRPDQHLIHVSTDCVFGRNAPSGNVVRYPAEPPNPDDFYGRTKLLGEAILYEPAGRLVTVVRTSFVGFRHGLMRWVFDTAAAQPTIEGWSGAWWSGSTVEAVAERLIDLAVEPKYGLQQLATSIPITKADAIRAIIRRFNLGLQVVENPQPVIARALAQTLELRPLAAALEALSL